MYLIEAHSSRGLEQVHDLHGPGHNNRKAHGTGTVAENVDPDLQLADGENYLGRVWVLETSKSTPVTHVLQHNY